jgi:hypothetical protein
MSSPPLSPTLSGDEPVWMSTLFPNTGYVRLWRACAGLFLAVGLFGLLHRAWNISADLEARRTWPSAAGEIVSAEQRDDSKLSLKVSPSNRTRYWVEYEVRFAVPEGQCRTGIVYTGASQGMPCHGIIRTRSTQSPHEVYEWLIHGYYVNEPVKVLHDPSSSEVKIVGQSIWLRYNFDRLMLNILWVVGFFALYAFTQRRLEYFKTHPEAETVAPESALAGEEHKLTDLNLS